MDKTIAEETSVPLSAYFSDNYVKKKRLYSQIEQILWVTQLKPNRVLEIGIGNGFVSTFLRLSGIVVDTVDVNPNLSPTHCSSVLDMSQIGLSTDYDVVLCAEVLEHLPFNDFITALHEIEKHTKKYAVITLPRCQRIVFSLNLHLKLYKIKRFNGHFFMSRKSKKIGRNHQWELNSSPVTNIRNIRNVFREQFVILKDEILDYHPYHHFFLLEKKTGHCSDE